MTDEPKLRPDDETQHWFDVMVDLKCRHCGAWLAVGGLHAWYCPVPMLAPRTFTVFSTGRLRDRLNDVLGEG